MKKTNKAIALLLALMLLMSSLFTLVSCMDPGNGDGGEGGGEGGSGGSGGGEGGGSGAGNSKVTYTVSVKTKGGMKMANLPVYVWSFVDGELDDLVGSTTTNANGAASFSLDPSGTYKVQVADIPDGYDVLDYYPLVSTNLQIEVESELITDNTSLSGVSYSLGDVMRDFTVTTTDGGTFKLSEALAEKDAVLINFFFTTCGPCVTEFQYMQQMYEQYADDLAIIAISSYPSDSEQIVNSFKQNYSNQFMYPDNVLGEELTFDMAYTSSTALVNAFGVSGYPTSVMIDRYGVISLIEVGAITSAEPFDLIFKHFTGDTYEQKLIRSAADLEVRLLPNVEQPSSDEIGAAIEEEGNNIDVTYTPDSDEYSWPFIITEKDGKTCLKSTNARQNNSYSIINATLNLNEGDVVAFDYFTSTEQGADILYVLVDDKDIYTISGVSSAWNTCYAYVADETREYTVSLCYIKDSSDHVGDDAAYISNFRVETTDDIDSPSYIFRFAATNPDAFGDYANYASVFPGVDGYYHVGSATGPILIADLMGYTRFSTEKSAYMMSLEKSYEDEFVRFCNYASNSTLNGKCSVTPRLAELLQEIAIDNGADPDDENAWLRFCCYYSAYGTNGAQFEDPIKGLAVFSAYDTIISTPDSDSAGAAYYPNKVTYNRVIMPRGLFFKFTPETSGTYLVRSNSQSEVNAWIFKTDGFEAKQAWLTYDNVDRSNTDYTNCYMLAYLEEGVDYYINIAFYDVYEYGTISFRVECVADANTPYYRFSSASPGYFTFLENTDGTVNKTISGGIDVVYDAVNDVWRENRDSNGDGVNDGSILYVDFTKFTNIFTGDTIISMIDKGAFDFRYSENDLYIIAIIEDEDIGSTAACDDYLREYWGEAYDEYAEIYQLQEVYDAYNGVPGAEFHGVGKNNIDKTIEAAFKTGYAAGKTYATIEGELIAALNDEWVDMWGEDDVDNIQQYIIDRAKNYIRQSYFGKYHGSGEDMTAAISAYISKMIDNCTNHKDDCPDGDSCGHNNHCTDDRCSCDGGEMNGCVVVNGELAELLQMLMDKYTFTGVENSWAKICYYHEYFGPTEVAE